MIGTTLSHFKITAKLGEGGMGEVYRATDTTLDREVAIKVLPEAFTQDPDRLARFQREAKVLASLNHPNIGSIYGLEEAEDKRFLVLELVEGEDLQQRLARGAIPVEEALELGRQMAEGLEVAHEKGIVHRDLKPANVKVTPEGQVKILDFGLAKAWIGPPRAGLDLSQSPTFTAEMTRAGTILGTAAYMSPEQARGEEVDKRADIWAFGAVLYESLTGRRAFEGESVAEVISATLQADPDWEALPPEVPGPARQLLRRCLEKDARQRLRDIGEARILLEGGMAEPLPGASTVAAHGADTRHWLSMAAAAALAFLLAWGLTSFGRPSVQELPLRKLQIDKTDLIYAMGGPAISPDGSTVAYINRGKLWVRRLASLAAREVPGSTIESRPIWSPDSLWIAYPAGRKLWKVAAGGGEPRAIADLPSNVGPFGGGWTKDGPIILTTGYSGHLSVSAQGGDLVSLLEPDAETEADFHRASLLPDGKGVLFSVHLNDRRDGPIALFNGTERRIILAAEGQTFTAPVYSPTGHLLYERSPSNPGIWALPFSLDRLEASGEPFLVVPKGVAPSISDEGTLIFVQGVKERLRELVWVDRGGRLSGKVGLPQVGITDPALSPDGTRVALSAVENDRRDIWIQDLELGTKTSLTLTPEEELGPRWAPDGTRLAFFVIGHEPAIQMRTLARSGESNRLGAGGRPKWSSDGRYLVYEVYGGRGIWYWEMDPETSRPEGEPILLLDVDGDESLPALAPDGRFLAYAADESGRMEVYLTDFPGGEGRWQVSAGGGFRPIWSRNGQELFFVDFEDRLIAARITTESEVEIGAPKILFDVRPFGLGWEERGYDVSPDGERFLMVRAVDPEEERSKLILVQNWIAEFEGDQ